MMAQSKIIVIGAGLGGLSAAIHLAAAGYQVEVFERNAFAGGKMGEWIESGYRFDTGPSLLTMPFVIDTLFEAAGETRSDYLTFEAVSPACRYFWDDGVCIDTHAEISRMQAELGKISADDANAYPEYLSYARKIYDLTAEIFLHTPLHEWRQTLKKTSLSLLLQMHKIDPLRTMHQSVSRFFSDPKTIQIFNRFATYNGSDPFQAPATLNIIPYVEYGLGAYYIKGGMYRLVESLLALCHKLDIAINLQAPVKEIVHRSGKVAGVVTENGFIASEAVVCNADVVEAHNKLVSDLPGSKQRLNKLEPSLSGMVFLWGVNKTHAHLAHHNIFFSNDYLQEFNSIFRDQRAPDDPTIYVAITSKSDPTHAPSGGENWFVLLNMPYLNGKQDWGREVTRMRRTVFEKLSRSGIEIEDHIEAETVWSPEDFYQIYQSNKGSIYGLSSNNPLTAFLRPANRSRDIEGLFFAGGSTHPGGGIPLVLLSGRMTAELVQEAQPVPRVNSPYLREDTKLETTTK